jgi:hypothetical protein
MVHATVEITAAAAMAALSDSITIAIHQFALALFTFCSTTALTSYSSPIIMHSFALALFTFCSTTALTFLF